MADLELLNKTIEDSGLKKVFIAEKLGITQSCLSNKLRGQNKFSSFEVDKMCEVLKLNRSKKLLIFYPEI